MKKPYANIVVDGPNNLSTGPQPLLWLHPHLMCVEMQGDRPQPHNFVVAHAEAILAWILRGTPLTCTKYAKGTKTPIWQHTYINPLVPAGGTLPANAIVQLDAEVLNSGSPTTIRNANALWAKLRRGLRGYRVTTYGLFDPRLDVLRQYDDLTTVDCYPYADDLQFTKQAGYLAGATTIGKPLLIEARTAVEQRPGHPAVARLDRDARVRFERLADQHDAILSLWGPRDENDEWARELEVAA